jgi:hypothetical protein
LICDLGLSHLDHEIINRIDLKMFKCFFALVFCSCLPTLQGQVVKAHNLTLKIQPVFLDKPLVLSSGTYFTSKGDTVSINRFRFYISGIVLHFENEEKYIERNSYHLIDAEDTSTYYIHLENIPAGNIQNIYFNIGVDSVASVSGALSGDLDPVKGMYWAWNSGYINAKLEGICKSKGNKNKLFEFHIGGYMQPYYAIRPVKLPLKNISGSSAKIILLSDLAIWLNEMDLTKENSVMIPGKAAIEIADKYSKMFRVFN